ncbi:hypothetical protein KCU77_g60, partial [Aureobasidium melanogenum]
MVSRAGSVLSFGCLSIALHVNVRFGLGSGPDDLSTCLCVLMPHCVEWQCSSSLRQTPLPLLSLTVESRSLGLRRDASAVPPPPPQSGFQMMWK